MTHKFSLALAFFIASAGLAYAESHEAPDTTAVVEQALAFGDPAAGEGVFRKCKACHEAGPDARAKVGPPLTNIIGALLGQVDGFNYSNTMVEMGEAGTTWTVENLDVYLTNPREFVNRTRMAFAGLRDETERADVIAYLASLHDAE